MTDALTPTLTVAVDFDGVTAELPELPDTPEARAALEDAPCDSLHRLMVDTPDGFDAETFARTHQEAVRQTLLTPDPVPGVKEGLRRIREAGHEVVITTNRPEGLAPFTRKWLQANDVPHDEVRHVGDGCRKGELPDVDVVIDDTPHNAFAAAEHGRLGVVFNREWTDTTAAREHHATVVADSWRDATRNLPGAHARAAAPTTSAPTPAAD